MIQRNISREVVRNYRCPKCQATEGERCIGVRGQARISNHIERVRSARTSLNRKYSF